MTAPDRLLARAIAAGLLPPEACLPPRERRPWPVVLLTALGAWLATLPMLGFIGLLLGDLLARSAGPYIAGGLVLALAVTVLRAQAVPLFLEQLAIPALFVGFGSLSFGLFRDLPESLAAALLSGLALGLAAWLPAAWMRLLLGAAAAACFILAWATAYFFPWEWETLPQLWLALHGALLFWLIAWHGQRWALGRVHALAEMLEAIGTGWLALTLVGLALLSGMTLLVGAVFDPGTRDLAGGLASLRLLREWPWVGTGSAALALTASLWAGRVWPGLRQPRALGLGLGLAGFAWFLPSLGAVWLAFLVTLTSGRRRLAGVAALAGAWILGSFYYQLSWSLAHKALVLMVLGLGFGGLAWGGTWRPGERRSGRLGFPRLPDSSLASWLIAAALLATLAVISLGIWQKETLIATGRPVFVALAPVDPRSLMQGDFMRLRFRLPAAVEHRDRVPGGNRPRAVARRDARGLATVLRWQEPGEVLAEEEFLLELIWKAGRWTLVTDAWFFREGEAAHWQTARYGEFRVAPDGQALLVGLADAALRPLGAQF